MTRSASKQDLVRSLGARPVVADALDPDAVAAGGGVRRARGDRASAHGAVRDVSLRDARHPDRSPWRR